MCEARSEGSWYPWPGRTRGGILAACRLIVCVLALLAQRAAAQGEPPAVTPSPPEGKESGPAADDSAGVKILLNGFLTQAYAISDGNQILGIPKQGTADYRTA